MNAPNKNQTPATGTYQHKNLTVHIKREYGEVKKFEEIITKIILQNVDSNLKPMI